MKIVFKFVFSFLFLVFATFNIADIQGCFVNCDEIAFSKQIQNTNTTFAVPQMEAFWALPEYKNDNSFSASTVGGIKSDNAQKFYIFPKEFQKINNTYIISSILKTEINPNAP